MQLRSLMIAGLVSLLLASGALAADVSGKWSGEMPARNGETRATTFTFNANGDQLTGTMSGPGGDVALESGKVSGEALSFSVTLNFGGNSIKVLFKGKVEGNQIKFTRQREGADQTQEFIATKSTT